MSVNKYEARSMTTKRAVMIIVAESVADAISQFIEAIEAYDMIDSHGNDDYQFFDVKRGDLALCVLKSTDLMKALQPKTQQSDPTFAALVKYRAPFMFDGAWLIDANGAAIKPSMIKDDIVAEAVADIATNPTLKGLQYPSGRQFFNKLADIMTEFWTLNIEPLRPLLTAQPTAGRYGFPVGDTED
jgi:hypothetical protein